jgi:hypothetical protein
MPSEQVEDDILIEEFAEEEEEKTNTLTVEDNPQTNFLREETPKSQASPRQGIIYTSIWRKAWNTMNTVAKSWLVPYYSSGTSSDAGRIVLILAIIAAGMGISMYNRSALSSAK